MEKGITPLRALTNRVSNHLLSDMIPIIHPMLLVCWQILRKQVPLSQNFAKHSRDSSRQPTTLVSF